MASTTERTREQQLAGEETLELALWEAFDILKSKYQLDMMSNGKHLKCMFDGEVFTYESDGPVIILKARGRNIPLLWPESKHQDTAGSAIQRLFDQSHNIAREFTTHGFSPFAAFCDGDAFANERMRLRIHMHFQDGFESFKPCINGNGFIKVQPWTVEEQTQLIMQLVERRAGKILSSGPGTSKS